MTQEAQQNNDTWITGTVLAAVPSKDERGDAYLDVEIQTPPGEIYAATIANWSQYMWPAYEEGKEVTCGLKQKRSGGYFVFATKGYKKPAQGSAEQPASGPAPAKPAAANPGPAETKAAPGGAVNRGEYLYSVTKSEVDLRADVFNHTSRLWAAGCASAGVTFHAFMEGAEGYIMRGEKHFELLLAPETARETRAAQNKDPK